MAKRSARGDRPGGPAAARSFSEGRLAAEPSDLLREHLLGPRLRAEMRMMRAYLAVDEAHAVMLAEQGILTPDHAARILRALQELRAESGSALSVDPRRGSLLLQIEAFIAERSGADVAGRLHTGRSRNDHSAAVSRLFLRDEMLEILTAVEALQQRVIALATEHARTLMPAYTHLQRAQPVTFGHYLLRHAYTFERDQQRLEGTYGRVDMSSLGGAALAGTAWPLRRERVGELLGHGGIVVHATDAGAFARDYPAELAAVLSILLSDVGRLAGDLYLWSSAEFDYVELPDDLAGTSSIMPQKKNPNALERVRALSGLAIGWVPAVLGVMRSASSTDLDLVFGPDPLPDMTEATRSALALMNATMDGLVVRTDLMAARAGLDWTTSTTLADLLVRRTGMSFRDAHAAVARLVRIAIDRGVDPADATTALLAEAAAETIGRAVDISDAELRDALDPRRSVESLVTPGSSAPGPVADMVRDVSERQRQHDSWLSARRQAVEGSRDLLRRAVASLADGR